MNNEWTAKRAPECDVAAREANIDGLLTFIIMRHAAWDGTSKDNPHRSTYLEARNNAIGELKWRIKELWFENDLRDRHSQRLCETLDMIREVLKERAGYENPVKANNLNLFP